MGRMTAERERTLRLQAREQFHKGVLMAVIARRLHVGAPTIRKWVADLRRSVPHPRTILTEAQVEEIRAYWLAGATQAALARAYGVSKDAIAYRVGDLSRDEQGEVGVNKHKQVIIDVVEPNGERALVLVQPTGRFEFARVGHDPEPQWVMEAFDTRDGRVHFFAVCDIRAWILPGEATLRAHPAIAPEAALARSV